MSGFERSGLGAAADADGGTVFECGICWHVYDPAAGDPVWQVAPGTPFAALPDHWSCPNCDAPRHKFLVVKCEA